MIVAKSQTKPRGAGSYWRDTPHDQLLDLIEKETANRRWAITARERYYSPDLADMAVIYSARYPAGHTPRGLDKTNTELLLAVQHSNAQRSAIQLYGGVIVPAADSYAYLPLSRYPLGKHTTGSMERLALNLRESLVVFVEKADDYAKTLKRLGKALLGRMELGMLLSQAGRTAIMPWSRLGLMDKMFAKQPTADAWTLLKCFGSVVKLNPELKQLDQTYRFYRQVSNLVGEE